MITSIKPVLSVDVHPMLNSFRKTSRLIIYSIFSLFAIFFSSAYAQTTDADTDALTNLEYIASYPDLMNWLGTNWQAGSDHYLNNGIDEGRTISFNSCEYLASNPDLMAAFGSDYLAAVSHYINLGRYENRALTFNGLKYMLANPDVLKAYSADSRSACDHYINYGRFDGHRKQPGRLLVGIANKCLDAGSAVATVASLVQIWDCLGSQPAQQQWTLRDDGRIVGIGGNCLTRDWGKLDNGTALVMQPCTLDESIQTWRLNEVNNLVSLADESKCVDIAGLSSANGAQAWVWDCLGTVNQKWNISGGLMLVNASGKCLDAGSSQVGVVGSQATLYGCLAGTPQREWIFNNAQLKGVGGLCLSMQGNFQNGAPLTMQPCADGPNGQHWYQKEDGTIGSIDGFGLCIAVSGGATYDGAPLVAWTCTPSASNFQWVQR